MNLKEVNVIEICPHEGKIKLVKILEEPRETCVLDYKHEVVAEFEYFNGPYGVDTFGFLRYDVRPVEVNECQN